MKTLINQDHIQWLNQSIHVYWGVYGKATAC